MQQFTKYRLRNAGIRIEPRNEVDQLNLDEVVERGSVTDNEQERSHSLLALFGEYSLHRCAISLEFFEGIFDPDLAGLEEAVEFIAGLDAEGRHELVSGDAVFAVGLDERVFEDGARGILAGGDELAGEIVRDVDGDLHGYSVHLAHISESRCGAPGTRTSERLWEGILTRQPGSSPIVD